MRKLLDVKSHSLFLTKVYFIFNQMDSFYPMSW